LEPKQLDGAAGAFGADYQTLFADRGDATIERPALKRHDSLPSLRSRVARSISGAEDHPLPNDHRRTFKDGKEFVRFKGGPLDRRVPRGRRKVFGNRQPKGPSGTVYCFGSK